MSVNKVEILLKREADRQQEILRKKIEQKLTSVESEKYTYFESVFDEKSKYINSLLDESVNLNRKQLNVEFDKMYKELNALKKFMSDSLIFLRNYDIRVYQTRLQEIEAKIKKDEETLLPKKKFGFKNKKATNDIIITNNPDEINSKSKDTVDNVAHKHSNAFEMNFFGFRNLSNDNVTLNHDDLVNKDVALHNLSDTIVNLPGTPNTLHMSSLTNCTILSGPVTTSVFAENCINCRLILACQQLRLHSSNNCKIYLHVTSKAIVEDCSAIKVAPYNYHYNGYFDDFKSAGLDLGTNNWDKLDDFNWLVAEKASPNWCILEEKERETNWEQFLK